MNTRRIALCLAAAVILSGGGVRAADMADPTATYMDNCVECHGPDAKGVKDSGVDLTKSAFLKGTDSALMEFLKVGRAAADRKSKTGLLMPAFDYLSDTEMRAIITFLDGKKAK